jgi:hypothetical protein
MPKAIKIDGITIRPKWQWSDNYRRYVELSLTGRGGVIVDENHQEHLFVFTPSGKVKLLSDGYIHNGSVHYLDFPSMWKRAARRNRLDRS